MDHQKPHQIHQNEFPTEILLFLVLLINRNSLRAASSCALKTMTDLNSLKPYILSFMFEAVAKTCSKC
jgi:hypothetical protein